MKVKRNEQLRRRFCHSQDDAQRVPFLEVAMSTQTKTIKFRNGVRLSERRLTAADAIAYPSNRSIRADSEIRGRVYMDRISDCQLRRGYRRRPRGTPFDGIGCPSAKNSTIDAFT
jgi:hypothetical protein